MPQRICKKTQFKEIRHLNFILTSTSRHHDKRPTYALEGSQGSENPKGRHNKNEEPAGPPLLAEPALQQTGVMNTARRRTGNDVACRIPISQNSNREEGSKKLKFKIKYKHIPIIIMYTIRTPILLTTTQICKIFRPTPPKASPITPP